MGFEHSFSKLFNHILGSFGFASQFPQPRRYAHLDCEPVDCVYAATHLHANSDLLYLPVRGAVLERFVDFAAGFSWERQNLVFTEILTPLLLIAAAEEGATRPLNSLHLT